MLTLSLLARKGGVGRTTTVFNLASAWAKEGHRCLYLDLDSQASLSRCLLGSEVVETAHPGETLAGIFDARFDPEPEEVIRATQFENLSVVSSGDALEHFNVTNPAKSGSQQFVLREFLEEVKGQFDVTLIDTGPNTCGLLSWASLVASDFVLSPVLCDAFGTQSIISVQRLTEHVQTTANPGLQIAGYFINMRQKNAVMDAYEQTLRRVHGGQMLKTVLPLAAAYRQAVVERTPLLMKKGRSKPVKTIIEFSEEVASRMLELTEQSRRVA